ncbi:MAG: DinB superfamily protein [Syntrophorhabdaceae bacterium PtaU1.Bin034]|nr:MAG: DinB superfamily protein [Syntrophorhabdaceae bacterium PtaU1.Bin034]
MAKQRAESVIADSGKILREELLALLEGGNAHMSYGDAVAGFPMEDINRRVPHGSYTMWHLLEHMRIVQWDILEFTRNPEHVSPDFPDGYWPAPDKKATPAMWDKTVKGFRDDLDAIQGIVRDPKTDFFGPIPHARDYTVLREMLLVADHNAFHVGELVALRRVLNMNPVKEY